jgi:glyoxylase-like metal-dependent hydrolase (beta-lactamase superfamily II)
VEKGVRLIGTDAWSLDRPYPLIGAEWRKRRDPSLLWPAHFAGIEREYCHIEKMANLDKLPEVGATRAHSTRASVISPGGRGRYRKKTAREEMVVFHPNAAEGVHRIEGSFTNWYLLEEDGRLTVVDTGVPTSWSSLIEALENLERTLSDIEAVVLTHAHFDHLGFAERARAELGVPVWVHENDVPLTKQPRQYAHERARTYYFATQLRAAPMVAAFVRNRAWWPRPIKEVRRYGGGNLPVPGSPRVVFTPGHTLGHCSLYLPDRDCLIAGDAIVTLDPYTARTGPRIVARAATADSERALASLEALAETGAGTVLVGHGEPWTAGIEQAVEEARRAGVS